MALVAGAALMASGCTTEFSIGGQSLESAGEGLIEGELADEWGEELDATCPEITDASVGATFTCTATTPTGETMNFAGVVDAEDHILLDSTNAILVQRLRAYEEAAAELLAPQIGAELTVDCGTENVILGQDMELTCTGTDEFGDSAPIIFSMTDLVAGDFDVRVG